MQLKAEMKVQESICEELHPLLLVPINTGENERQHTKTQLK